ncbi:hypothetical protein RFI_09763, partial [Reticulomyxa filosa]
DLSSPKEPKEIKTEDDGEGSEDEAKLVDPELKDLSTITTEMPNEAIHSKKDTSFHVSFILFIFINIYSHLYIHIYIYIYIYMFVKLVEEIRRQLSAMRQEQDLFSTAFEQSILELQTEHQEHMHRQSLIDLQDAKSLKDEKLLSLEKFRLALSAIDSDNGNDDGHEEDDDESSYSEEEDDDDEEEEQQRIRLNKNGTFITRQVEDEYD